ncbi:MAG: LamG domain-containing protein [Armatimonadetes bacterium]|nr:LamG domain-containing protein [Armatimonadota bacterium]
MSGKAVSLDGTGFLRVNEPAVFNAPDLTVDFWINPANLKGRRGLVAKRYGNSGCPFVINQTGATVGFEATDEQGKWSFNFTGPAKLKENEWSRVTVVMKTGSGVRVFVDGKPAAAKENPLGRQDNNEPLILGREAWGGDPATTAGPGFFIGLMDQVRIWTRALTDAEVAAGK